MKPMLYAAIALTSLLAAEASRAETAIRYLECPVVQYFVEGCAPVSALPELPPPPVPSPHGTNEYPLFPPETLARDTPPLMRELLHNPTPENARRYLAWQRERQERIEAVQRLIKAVSEEK